jgi:hypothetical protein
MRENRQEESKMSALSRLLTFADLVRNFCILLLFSMGCGGQMKPEVIDIKDEYSLATFAGGCFWCMEPPFEALPGGGGGGERATWAATWTRPTYDEVCTGETGHLEGGAGALRSGAGGLRQPAGGVLAQHRPHRRLGPVCRQGQPVPHGRLLPRRGATRGGPRPARRPWRPAACLSGPS